MVAHEVVGCDVAQRVLEFGRALQVGEHDGDQPISALSPGEAIAQGRADGRRAWRSPALRPARAAR